LEEQTIVMLGVTKMGCDLALMEKVWNCGYKEKQDRNKPGSHTVTTSLNIIGFILLILIPYRRAFYQSRIGVDVYLDRRSLRTAGSWLFEQAMVK
jgi:hypothetical protein